MMRNILESFSFCPIFLQCTSHDFENNRKTMLMERNLLSRKVSQPPLYTQKCHAAPVLNFNSMSRQSLKSKASTTHCEESLKITLLKEAIALICDSSRGSEIFG